MHDHIAGFFHHALDCVPIHALIGKRVRIGYARFWIVLSVELGLSVYGFLLSRAVDQLLGYFEVD
jgi:hypothetical protein